MPLAQKSTSLFRLTPELNATKKTFLAVAAFSTLGLANAGPASAAVVIGFNGVQTDQNVLFPSSTETPSPTLIAETNQTDTVVTFANTLRLVANASGQSSATTSSDGLFGTTTVTIAPGSVFTTASFNLEGIPGNPPPAEATSVLVQALGLNGTLLGMATSLPLAGNGENRISISGNAGELFSGFRISLVDGGVASISQVRFGGVTAMAAVPEPTTWMLMLIGMAGIGFSMRRKEKQTLRVRYV